MGGPEFAYTDQSGRFKLEVSRSGSFTLMTSKSGFKTDRQQVNLNKRFVDVTITLNTLNKADQKTQAQAVAESSPDPVQATLATKAPQAKNKGKVKTHIRREAPRRNLPPPTPSSYISPPPPATAFSDEGYGRSTGSASAAAYEGRRRMAKARPAPKKLIAQTSADRDESAGGDEYQKIDESEYRDPSSSPLSTFSIDVDTASYSNLRRFIQNNRRPPVDAVKIEEMVNYFNYNYEAPLESDPHPFKVYTELAESPWNPTHKLLHIGLQGRKIEASKLPPSNLVFLLDVSGSMSGPDRLPLLKQALMLLSGTLRPQDKVSIVVYAGAAGVVLPPTPGSQRRTIIEAFSKLQAGGSTAGGAGIQLAYKLAEENFIKGGNNRVILATDGDFNVGTSSQGELVRLIERKRKSGVFLTVLGFGRGNYRASTMSELAEKGNGNHAYIDSILEAQKVLVSEMGGTLFTIAKDVKIQVEFNPTKVSRYRLIGYQSRILAARDFNDDKKDAGELGAGHSVTALYEIIPSGESVDKAGEVDQLKYQKRTAKESDEWLTVKLRYKRPDGDKSTLLTHPHLTDRGDWREASEDFRFAAGVAEFGMILRNSKHLEEIKEKKWDHVLGVIKGATGHDEQGYRNELLDLVKRAQNLR
jgi:Ca-activated chloride channel family protein